MTDQNPPGADGPSRPVRVLKFGGTSVGSAEVLNTVVQIVDAAAEDCWPVVVVSAAAGVTDALVRAAEEVGDSRAGPEDWACRIGRRYRRLADAVLEDATIRTRYATVLDAERAALRRALGTLADPSADAARDDVLAAGERLMAPLLAGALLDHGRRAQAVETTALIRAEATPGDTTVKWESTRNRIRNWYRDWAGGIPVLTGFIAGTPDGRTTTLGRGGSDRSAALVARALAADRLERWTDVDGLYTRDPDVHDDARRLDHLDFEQARAWTKEGRLGMHRRTLDPLVAAGIPLHVRSTHRPDGPGTRIGPAAPVSSH